MNFSNKVNNSLKDVVSVIKDIGIVLSVADGIVNIKGLSSCAYGEKIEFITSAGKVPGMILNLTKNNVSAVVFSKDMFIKSGQLVVRTFKLMTVPVGRSLLGRIIDPLGNPIDGLGQIVTKEQKYIETVAASIIKRTPVREPIESGLKVVDSLVPIGHGQRELIIGDTKTGKTSNALDLILNQKGVGVISIYVAIGQKRSSVARISKLFTDFDCLKFTIIVAATASDSAALQYIAPYSGCTIGEYFMEKGLKCVVVYDDLSKHAVSYRQISLLLRRPPGREGYPGDVFYLHSRLLERSANLLTGGSLTALPIIETIQGDVSSYIPTNVISITDGQIFLETELFSKGIRPAVSPGLSVSRVGSAAQRKILKKMAGSLKLELAQFREVENFTKLGFALDEATAKLVKKGLLLTKVLTQKRFSVVKVELQVFLLWAVLNGYLDWLPVELIDRYQNDLCEAFTQSLFYLPIISYDLTSLDSIVFEKILYDFTKKFIYYYNDNLRNYVSI